MRAVILSNNNNTFSRMDVSSKMEPVNVKVFKLIKGISESKTLAKNISCECKCGFDGRKCSTKQKWSNDKFQCECKRPMKHSIKTLPASLITSKTWMLL